jgi:hypothetical protein
MHSAMAIDAASAPLRWRHLIHRHKSETNKSKGASSSCLTHLSYAQLAQCSGWIRPCKLSGATTIPYSDQWGQILSCAAGSTCQWTSCTYVAQVGVV